MNTSICKVSEDWKYALTTSYVYNFKKWLAPNVKRRPLVSFCNEEELFLSIFHLISMICHIISIVDLIEGRKFPHRTSLSGVISSRIIKLNLSHFTR